MKFQVGDRVIYTSNQWGDGEMNPLWGGKHGKIVGTIDEIRDTGDYIAANIGVMWDSCHNCYFESDLEFAIDYLIGDLKEISDVPLTELLQRAIL